MGELGVSSRPRIRRMIWHDRQLVGAAVWAPTTRSNSERSLRERYILEHTGCDRLEHKQSLEEERVRNRADEVDVNVLHSMRRELQVPRLRNPRNLEHLGEATRPSAIGLNDVHSLIENQVPYPELRVLVLPAASGMSVPRLNRARPGMSSANTGSSSHMMS